MKKIAIAVLILATLCSFAAAEPKYTYGYEGPRSESSISGGYETPRSETYIPESYTYGYETPRSESYISGPKYTYGYTALQSEIRIPDPSDFLGVVGEYFDSLEGDEGEIFDIYAYTCSGAVNAPLLFADYADYAATAGCECLEIESEYVTLAKGDMMFLLSVYEDDPSTVYLVLDSRLTVGEI